MISATITFEGNIANDPQIRFTGRGIAVCELRVIVNDRTKKDGEWVDAEPTAFQVVTWRRLAENVGDSLNKGDRVMVCGRPLTEAWTDQATNERRSAQKIHAEMVGLSLAFTPAKPVKTDRTSSADSPDEWATSGPTEDPPF